MAQADYFGSVDAGETFVINCCIANDSFELDVEYRASFHRWSGTSGLAHRINSHRFHDRQASVAAVGSARSQ
jgi:hypothetical protein